MNSWPQFFVVIVIAGLVSCCPSKASSSRTGSAAAGIRQIVDAGAHGPQCVGLVIELATGKLNGRITSDELSIRDGKYGRELKELMTWQVGRGGRLLTIRFKPGLGDFGTGNHVTVTLNRTAFAVAPRSPNERFEWGIDTDVL